MFVNVDTAQSRYGVCRGCEYFKKELKICNRCGCFMPLKVTIARAKCPVNKWAVSSTSSIQRTYTIKD
jgi:hypothetical protein